MVEFDLFGEFVENDVFFAVGIDKVMASHLEFALQSSVDSTVSLFHARWIPRDIVVEEIGAMSLKIYAFPGCVCSNENTYWMLVGRAVEGPLDFSALIIAEATVEDHDPAVAIVSVGERAL